MPTPRIVPGTLKLTNGVLHIIIIVVGVSYINSLALGAISTASPGYVDHPC